MGWVLWHSRSGHSALPAPHSRVVVQVPAMPLQSSSLLLRLHVEETDGVSGSWLWPGQAPSVVATLGVNCG